MGRCESLDYVSAIDTMRRARRITCWRSGAVAFAFSCVKQTSNTNKVREAAFPAGMEPTGIERHGRSRDSGERAGASESIEADASCAKQTSNTNKLIEAAFPAGIEPTFKV